MFRHLGAVFGAALGLVAAPAFADMAGDLSKALNKDGRIVWLIYGVIDREKVEDVIAQLAPVKDRVRIGVYHDWQSPIWEQWQDRFAAEGFKVCKSWGEGTGLNNGVSQGSGDLVQEQQWVAMQVSNSDALMIVKGARTAEVIAAEWEMGGVSSGAASGNFVFGNLVSETAKLTRVKDDALASGIVSFSYQNGAQSCFWE